jgi:hypothetical protein
MTRSACTVLAALLLLFLTAPVLGKNYFLHSPKLWSPQEKDQYEKEHPSAKEEKKAVVKQKVPPQKAPAKKRKIQTKKNQVLVKDGVSYREVIVQDGDTLFGISRRYSKEGASYAETLRFNDIEDPDQIVSGDIIRVPLSKKKKTEQLHQAKPILATPPKHQTIVSAPQKPVPAKPAIPSPRAFSSNSSSRQKTNQPAIIKSPAETAPTPAKTIPEKQPTFTNHSTSGPELFEQAIKAYRSGDCHQALTLFNRFLAGHANEPLAADAHLFIADCYLRLSGK